MTHHLDWATKLAIVGDLRDLETKVPLEDVTIALESKKLVGQTQSVILPQRSDRDGKLSATYETGWGCEQSAVLCRFSGNWTIADSFKRLQSVVGACSTVRF